METISSVVEFQLLKSFINTPPVLSYVENIIYIEWIIQKTSVKLFIVGKKLTLIINDIFSRTSGKEHCSFFFFSLYCEPVLPCLPPLPQINTKGLKDKYQLFLFLENSNPFKTFVFQKLKFTCICSRKHLSQ